MTAALSVSMVAAALMSFSMMTAASSVVPFPVMAALRIRIIRKLSLGKRLSSLIRIARHASIQTEEAAVIMEKDMRAAAIMETESAWRAPPPMPPQIRSVT